MIKPQFSYCPLIWMCSSRKFMTEIYKIINGYTPPVKDNFLILQKIHTAAKIRKKGFRKVFNVSIKSHCSNFEVGS